MKIRAVHHVSVILSLALLTGCFKTRADIAREQEDQEVRSHLQQNMADYSQNLERIRNEIGRLQGRIDELEHSRRKDLANVMSSRETDQKSHDKVMDDLRAKITALQESQKALFEEVKKIHEERLSERASPAPIPTKKKGSASYESALSAFKAKDYEAVIAGMRSYLDSNPRGKYSLDARYYLGESLYQKKEYEKAAVEFGAVQERSPSSAQGRKSTLRLAQSFKAMGKNKDAKAFAELLIQGNPNSEEAKAARKMLK